MSLIFVNLVHLMILFCVIVVCSQYCLHCTVSMQSFYVCQITQLLLSMLLHTVNVLLVYLTCLEFSCKTFTILHEYMMCPVVDWPIGSSGDFLVANGLAE